MPDSSLKTTPLIDEHRRLGARLVPFAGWSMPVQYNGIIQEHRAVRQDVGMFDVSHMGEFRIGGPNALDFLQDVTVNDVARLDPGKSQYSALLGTNGTMLDDVMLYRTGDTYLLVVNASNVDKIDAWLQSRLAPGVELENVSAATALIAVQGPSARAIVQKIAEEDVLSIGRFYAHDSRVADILCLVARTGYTGEDGFEIFCPWDAAVPLWHALREDSGHPIQPCGLGARDTLRLESGKLLYGNDMNDETNPLEAGLDFIVKMDKGDFVGREALLVAKARGLFRRLVGFEMVDRGVPRHQYAVASGGDTVGAVTSGGYAPTLDRNIGLAYVPPHLTALGTPLDVIIRENPVRAQIVKVPFYRLKKS